MISTDALYTAVTIYHESRGEPKQCQVLVAEVIRNRMDNRDKTAKEVVKEKGQFTWTWLIRNKTIDTEFKRIQLKARGTDKEALTGAVLIANKVLSPVYVPKTGMNYFHDKSVKRKHKDSIKCGDLIFYKR